MWKVPIGHGLLIVDLDNDGLQDIFVTNGHARDTMNSDYVNESKQKLSASPEEKKEHFLNLPPINESNIAFQNKGDLQFESVGDLWKLDLNMICHRLKCQGNHGFAAKIA